MWLALMAGAGAGLASVPHCLGMCGPLAAYACSRETHGAPVQYLVGRVVSYSLAGALVGSMGAAVVRALPEHWVGLALSWTLSVGLAWAAWRLWRRERSTESLIAIGLKRKSEQGWVRRTVPALIGLLTVALPCGALAAGLLIAASTASAATGAAVMGAFSVASGIGLLGAGWLSAKFANHRMPAIRRGLAVVLAVGAVVFVFRPLRAESHGGHCAEVAHP